MAHRSGFVVGCTVQSCTKGVWLFRKPLHETDDLCVFVLDTEGIDSLDAGDSHDLKIFTLALLLSSSFLMNSAGPAIDEQALNTLRLRMHFVRDQVHQLALASSSSPAAAGDGVVRSASRESGSSGSRDAADADEEDDDAYVPFLG